MKLLIYIAVSVLLNGCGQLLLKKGMNNLSLQNLSNSSVVSYLLRVVTYPLVLAGIVFYAASLLIWLQILTKVDVSLAYPIVISLTFIAVTIGAAIFLGENVTLIRILGIGLIILGVVIVSRS